MSAAAAFEAQLAAERLADRAARLLARPGALIEALGGGYAVRFGPGRRRPMLTLDAAAFGLLARDPGLRPRDKGGWVLAARAPAAAAPPPPPGRPGLVLGETTVVEPDGRRVTRLANLGESPIAWLARRRDADGRPWLSPAQIAAAERLSQDVRQAGTLGRLTMDWEAAPRVGGGRGPGLDPAERGAGAKRRVAAALAAVGPGLAEMLEKVCRDGLALGEAERRLGLPRRAGKTVLSLALGRLAGHYGLG